jgi:hypothetical protein
MRNRDHKSQGDRKTKTSPPSREVKRTLEGFWRYQLNQIKECAELQARKPVNRGK